MTGRKVVAVDQQREQDKAGRQHRDETLNVVRQRWILGDREREHQGQRAPHPAPGDRELVGVADRLGQPGEG